MLHPFFTYSYVVILKLFLLFYIFVVVVVVVVGISFYFLGSLSEGYHLGIIMKILFIHPNFNENVCHERKEKSIVSVCVCECGINIYRWCNET